MTPLLKSNKWLKALRKACEETSQSKVAARLRQPDGFPSPTVINQVLNDKYPGRKERLQALVEGVYMNRTVDCPVLGTIKTDLCIDHQSRSFSTHNPLLVQLYRACRDGCPETRIAKD
ncbi:XRE family transcriptional regulator [Candidatus Vondammii sp. HM_W22]|uniref:XRE family transcriptional regulator n=1 Tax=Candidatus Vondammii sp. HM_W22 TaxID=2687299 RepID=UPI001F1339D0|nr:XRE family transcriptional regulator [Candidatus Vondammii sp. HM_W22]